MSVNALTNNQINHTAKAHESERAFAGVKRYGAAIFCVGLAFCARYLMSPLLGEELPFTLFIAAAMVAAWYGGAAAGIVALLLGLLLADCFFVGSSSALGSRNVGLWVHVTRYIFTASLGIGLIEVLHRARRRTEKALDDAREETARRRESEKQLRDAHALLRKHAAELDRRIEERTAALRANVDSLHEILYNIAHCLRAPVRATACFSSLFLEHSGRCLDPVGENYIFKIREAAEKMDALTLALLEYGVIAEKEAPLTEVRLEPIVREAVGFLKERVEAEGANISIGADLPTVRGNTAILQRIVMELVDNALKFAKPGVKPKIRIWSESGQDRVRLWVEDNGIGIEPFYQDRIFRVFEQAHPTRDRHGTGIGLAIVKQGMERQGGSAGVDSQGSGGSRFWLEFPG